MKKYCLFSLLLLQFFLLNPGKSYATIDGSDYSRWTGFFIRPELNGGLSVAFGYQFNPFFQFSSGIGAELNESEAFPEINLGFRAYASDKKVTLFIDYHLFLTVFYNYGIINHRCYLGISFWNFDLGGGIGLINLDGTIEWVPCLTMGYNFRF